VLLGYRDQLGHLQTLADALADDGGDGVLVAALGRGRDRQPQAVPAGQRPRC
jgi:hypothetical protein